MRQKRKNEPKRTKHLVYADWLNDAQPALMGNLSAIQISGKEVFTFENFKDWLKSNYIHLDPDLQFFSGR